MSTPRVWFITGVSSGIGRAAAEAALARGDTVYGSLRQSEQFAAFEQLAPGRAFALQLDVTQPGQITHAVQRVLSGGRIDVLVNNAGIGMVGAVEESSLAEVRSVFEINFFGALQLMQAFLPQMRRQKSGHIINISSGVGLNALPGMPIYSASKHALEGLSEALAGEVAALGIKVSLIEPGAILTGFTGPGMVEAQHKLSDYEAVSGYGRAGLNHYYQEQAAKPETVAQAILAVADHPAPPLRKLVGSDVPHAARTRLERMQQLLDAAQT